MASLHSIRGILASAALVAALLVNGCGGGGGGGGTPTPTATLTVAPLTFSAESEQVVTLTPTVTNVAAPVYTYTLQPPASMTRAATAAEIADRFGTLNATTGAFTAGPNAEAGLSGAIIVRETTRNLSFTVPLIIVPFVDHVTIDPAETSLLANQSQAFSATAFDIDGEPIDDYYVDWRVTGGIGSVNAAGLFLARNAGEGTVTARVGGAAAAAAQVTVVGSVTGLSIRPAGNPIEVEAGTQRQFKAIVSDANSNETEVTATWEVTTATGTITAAGLFTASATVGASGTLTARYSGQTASLPLRVVELVTPPSGPFNVRGTVTTAADLPAAGALVEARLVGQTAVVDSASATADGTYRLWLPAGSYQLTATLGTATDQASVVLVTQDVLRVANLQLAP